MPKNDAGYDVYARALAKPTENPDMTITPDLIAVEDEFGNDLMYLGLVKSNGFETPYETFTRKKARLFTQRRQGARVPCLLLLGENARANPEGLAQD